MLLQAVQPVDSLRCLLFPLHPPLPCIPPAAAQGIKERCPTASSSARPHTGTTLQMLFTTTFPLKPPPNITSRNAHISAGSFTSHKPAQICIFPAPITSEWPDMASHPFHLTPAGPKTAYWSQLGFSTLCRRLKLPPNPMQKGHVSPAAQKQNISTGMFPLRRTVLCRRLPICLPGRRHSSLFFKNKGFVLESHAFFLKTFFKINILS